jgi:hypothetical protein
MSLNTLALLSWKSIIVKEGCTISDREFKIHSPIKNGLCVWGQSDDFSPAGDANALFASIAPKNLTLTDLHERLAHVSKDTLLKYGKSAFEDLDPTDLIDEHWYMTDYHVSRDTYYQRPMYPLKAVNIEEIDYIAGPLEDWIAGALTFSRAKKQYAFISNAEMMKPYCSPESPVSFRIVGASRAKVFRSM